MSITNVNSEDNQAIITTAHFFQQQLAFVHCTVFGICVQSITPDKKKEKSPEIRVYSRLRSTSARFHS